MANQTVTAVVNGSAQAINATSDAVDIGTATHLFITVVLPSVLERLFVFVAAPFLYPDMWWLLIHLILTFVLFEFYYERHVDEDLGWGAALANSIVMIFISLELLRHLYHHDWSPLQTIWQVVADYLEYGLFLDKMIIVSLIFVLFGLGIATAIINYFHILPKQLAFLFSGHKLVNLLAYTLMVFVWSWKAGDPLPVDSLTLTSALLFGLLLMSLFFFLNSHGRRKKLIETVTKSKKHNIWDH